MSIFAEAFSPTLTPQDWQYAIRAILLISGACAVGAPIFMVYRKFFGKYATLEALRARTDPLEQRIRALEVFRAEVEKERSQKLIDRINELQEALEARDERRKKHH